MDRAVYADAGDDRRDDWETPDWLFVWCEETWGPFLMDAAASPANSKCEHHWGAAEDALIQAWLSPSWCNPPYSMVEGFTDAAASRAKSGVCSLLLLPARTDTIWFHKNVLAEAAELVLLCGRIPFVDPTTGKAARNATFPSCLAWYAPRGRGPHMPFVYTQSVAAIRKGVHVPKLIDARQTSILEASGNFKWT